MSYFSNISDGVKTTFKGMRLAISYFFDARKKRKKEYINDANYYEKAEGIFTVQYPKESIPIPDNGRYQLHNEIDDCIVCDKCAKICPVDCIDIEPVRAPEVFGETSDGTPLRIHAAKFDIDMAKCCFCGLCTVVCPTECLTMTKDHDFSTTDILDHNFSFSKMSEMEIVEKKQAFETYQAEKEQAKADLPEIKKASDSTKNAGVKPKLKPKVSGAKPVVKPKVPVAKPKIQDKEMPSQPSKKPIIRPVVKPKTEGDLDNGEKSKKPMMKPKIPKKK